jgi:1,4-dihydroxy-2-naphthoate octaprenyltransferase
VTRLAEPAGAVPAGRIGRWVMGARPRTLPAAAVPVVVGTAVGHFEQTGGLLWWRAAAAMVVALGIQVGANYANDYADGVRGSDDARVGPLRLTSSGLADPGAVRAAALCAYGVAGAAGLALAAATTWWLVGVGAASFLAGWLYTGGPRPYGYAGLGEPFVFAFFGVVATAGSAFVQVDRLALVQLAASVPTGLLSVSLLESNNLRDLAGDAAVGKRTLAVRLGARAARWLYVGTLAAAFLSIGWLAWWRPIALVALAAAPLAWRPVRLVLSGAERAELLPVLADTGRLQLAVGVLLAAGILA